MPRYLTLIIVCLLSLIWALGAALAQTPPHYTELSFPQLPQWPKVKPQSFTLPNKARLLVLEDHELPLVTIRIMVRTGEVDVPKGLEGLGQVFAESMRNGGSADYAADALNTLLENKAANLSVSVDFAATEVTLSLLRSDLEDLLPVLGDFLARPLFPEQKIALAKQHLLTEIARRNDDQQEVAFREFKRMVYGPETVYGRLPQSETVQRISREDVQKFYQDAFCTANMLIGVVGDVQAQRIRGLLQKCLQPVPVGRKRTLTFPAVQDPSTPHKRFIDLPDVNQVSILMGHEGGRRQDPDFAPLQIMNAILSKGFTSRLFQHLRTKMGLAYSVYGRYGSKVFYPGVFLAGLKTKSASMLPAAKALKDELDKLRRDGVTAQEVQRAKKEFLNSLVFRYDTPEEILSRYMYYAYRDMPDDSFEQLVQEVKSVQARDVNRVAKKCLHLDRLQTLMVGNKDQVQKQLEQCPDMQVEELE